MSLLETHIKMAALTGASVMRDRPGLERCKEVLAERLMNEYFKTYACDVTGLTFTCTVDFDEWYGETIGIASMRENECVGSVVFNYKTNTMYQAIDGKAKVEYLKTKTTAPVQPRLTTGRYEIATNLHDREFRSYVTQASRLQTMAHLASGRLDGIILGCAADAAKYMAGKHLMETAGCIIAEWPEKPNYRIMAFAPSARKLSEGDATSFDRLARYN